MADDIRENAMAGGTPARLRGLDANGNSISPTIQEVAETFGKGYAADLNNETDYGISGMFNAWKIQCKLPPKTKRFCPLVLK